jgi:hypothetical protein
MVRVQMVRVQMVWVQMVREWKLEQLVQPVEPAQHLPVQLRPAQQ